MDVHHLIGDAFGKDAASASGDDVCGSDITESRYTATVEDIARLTGKVTSTPKCNSIAFVKPEPRPADARSTCAAAGRFVCYTVKGTMIRLIDKVTGEKALLKGHMSPIADIVFSPIDDTLLCSVDMGGSDGAAMVWRLVSSADAFSFDLVARFPVNACIARAHPVHSDIWCLSDGYNVALVSSKQQDMSFSLTSYADYHATYQFSDRIEDISFSADGAHMVVAAGSGGHGKVHLFDLPAGLNNLHSRRELLVPKMHVPIANVRSAAFLSSLQSNASPSQLITAAEESASEVNVSVWNIADFHDKPVALQQSVTVRFPALSVSRAGASDESFHSHMSFVTNSAGGASRSFLVLAQRNSAFACVLAVAKTFDEVFSKGNMRLYHVSYLDIGKPLICLSACTVDESCVNPNSSQQNLDQSSNTSASSSASSRPYLELTVMQDMLNAQLAIQQFHIAAAAVVPPPHNKVAATTAPTTTTTTTVIEQATTSTDVAVPTAAVASSPETAPAATSAPTVMSSANMLLNMLSAGINPLISNSLPPTGISNAHIAAADNFPFFALAPGAPAPEPVPAVISASAPTTNATAADLGAQKGMKLMSILKKTPSPDAAPSAAAAVTESPLPANVNPFGNQGYETRSEDEEEVEESTATAVKKTSAKSPPRKAASKNAESSPLIIPAPLGASLVRTKSSDLYAIDGADDNAEVKNLTNAQLRSIVAIESMKAVESVLANYRWKDELSSQISDDLRTELTVVLGDSVKSAIKAHLKESVKESLSKSFKTAFESTLVPAFQVGVSVLHNKLQTSFDSAAQSLNSVAAERREMSGVTERLNSLETEVSSLRKQLQITTADLERSRTEQRTLITEMTKSLSETITSTISTSIASTMASTGAGKQPCSGQVECDPWVLFEQHRLSDSLECALEKRNVGVLVGILGNVATPEVVLKECGQPVLLCIVQQLALDLAHNDPVEGLSARLDWLKELVVAIVSQLGDSSATAATAPSVVGGPSERLDDSLVIRVLRGVFDCLKLAETRLQPVGSTRSDLRILCSVVAQSF